MGTRIAIADTSLTRLVGLMGRRRLDAGCGLLIRPSCGIHTFGMLFSIDVVALDRSLRVVKVEGDSKHKGVTYYRLAKDQSQ